MSEDDPRPRIGRRLGKLALLGVLACCGCAGATAPPRTVTIDAAAPQPPDLLFGALFVDVQQAKLFADQKTFADAVPRREPAAIVADYLTRKGQPGFDLAAFVTANFDLPDDNDRYVPPAAQTLRQHIDGLWDVLTRQTSNVPAYGSLLPLPRPYVVPGGRFREAYYWDTYFTMLGLAQSQRWDLIADMVENFAHELDQYGRIPNGNRSYYLSRSQPPFFAFMLDLLASHQGDAVYARYLPQLKIEYAYWMAGADRLPRGQASERVVRLDDGSVLNRYWDDRDVPRTESYLDDVTTAGLAAPRPSAEVYRDLRAAAASGWDFSSRWLADRKNLASIRTTAIVPIDLNSLLYHLELTLVRASAQGHDPRGAVDYGLRAARRLQAINQHLWNRSGYYADYNWRLRRLSDQLTAATVYPLFVGAAPTGRAWSNARSMRDHLLKAGGLATTELNTGQQWDAPNGWAPLQWMAVQGLRNYHQDDLAQTIGLRFLANVQRLYDSEHKLVEKYVVDGNRIGGGGGGEYPLQDGFGWTNGVTLQLLATYPCAPAACAAAKDITATLP